MKKAAELQNVCFSYEKTEALEGTTDTARLKNASLSICEGEFLLITGISGSGKSTLTKCINGLIPRFFEGRFSGGVYIHGQNIDDWTIDKISHKAGSVFQSPKSQFFTDDVISELAFACENYGTARSEIIDRISEVCTLLQVQNLLFKRLEHLSNGEKQKIAIASALTLQANIIVLDEPSSNLDFHSIRILSEVLALLKQKGFTIIIAEHRLYYLKDLFDRVIYIKDGKIDAEYGAQEFNALKNAELNARGLRSVHLFKDGTLPLQPLFSARKTCERTAEAAAATNDLAQKGAEQNGDEVCRLSDISFSFNDGTEILNGIDLSLRKNEITALTGKNGAGKTTLAKIISGIYVPDSGTIRLNGKIVSEKERIEQTNFVMQDVEYQLFGSDVFSELLIGSGGIPDIKEKVTDALKKLDLYNCKDAHPFSLSMGQKQRLIIAATYVRGCPVTILDEPTSGLDYGNMQKVGSLLREIARTSAVLVITHDFEFISTVCNRIVLLENTRITRDSMLDADDGTLEHSFSTL
ncbi:energy-coupling factor ABC transporter ATP-binding protein [Treponema sp. HNW]|uniref:ABC transporter ATP-binding protein n=1 Tax=Treponema sp. HNW TaxID=3116654 RepID=UPI003D136C48